MPNSMVVLTFSKLDHKNPIWANLVQKIKIFSLSRNLLPSLIRIYAEFTSHVRFFYF